jgi:UDP-2,3-diacylglucosamine hydrolase
MQTQGNKNESTSSDQTGLVLFISDCHLCPSRPHITAAFLKFLSETATHAQALYILGDLFEYWAGDDDRDTPFHQSLIKAFAQLAAQGCKLFFIHGNRDFLIADEFCKASHISLLADPSVIQLHGKRVLLSHGDALCTDDTAYQAMRLQFRSTDWQTAFLKQPLPTRKEQIAALRMQSNEEKSKKSEEIMDVNPEALAALLQQYHYPEVFIHGHTHRPASHLHNLNGHAITRWVLADWYDQGSYLAYDAKGCRAVPLE